MSGLKRLRTAAREDGSEFAARFRDSIAAGWNWLARKPRPQAPLLRAVEREQWMACTLFALGLALAGIFFVDPHGVGWAQRLPDWLVIAVNRYTDFGRSSYMLWPLAFMLLLCAVIGAMNLPAIQNRVLATVAVRLEFLFVAIAVPGLFATIVKYLIGRARPLVPDAPDVWLFAPFSGGHGFSSLPSGHAVAAFSLLVAAGSLWPRAVPYLVVYAVTIAISRVVVIAHFPSDVLAGALIGAFGAYLVRNAFAARGLAFHYDSDGRVVAKPGPSLRRLAVLERGVCEKP